MPELTPPPTSIIDPDLVGIGARKTALRRELRRTLRAVTLEEVALASGGIVVAVKTHPAWGTAKTVGLFAALADAREPDLAALHNTPGKVFAYPRVLAEGAMDFCAVTTPAELREQEITLPGGRLVTLVQPGPEAPTVPVEALDLILVPGMGFTATGNRLGRGGGFYDRFLGTPGLRAVKLGVALRCQVLEDLPAEPHDQRLDGVLVG